MFCSFLPFTYKMIQLDYSRHRVQLLQEKKVKAGKKDRSNFLLKSEGGYNRSLQNVRWDKEGSKE